MASSYYLPQGLVAFKDWCVNFEGIVSTDFALYGLTSTDASDFAGLLATYTANLTASTTPVTRTPVSIAATRTTYDQMRALAQSLVQKYQASGTTSPAKSTNIAVTVRDDTKTPIPAPTAIPDLGIEKIEPQTVTLRIKELGVILNALPVGCVGYEVYGSVGLTNPPNSPSAMSFMANGSRRFITIPFETADIGKNVSFAVRYRTAKNLVGPWSSIITCTVSAG